MVSDELASMLLPATSSSKGADRIAAGNVGVTRYRIGVDIVWCLSADVIECICCVFGFKLVHSLRLGTLYRFCTLSSVLFLYLLTETEVGLG